MPREAGASLLTAEQQQKFIDVLFAWFMYHESDAEPSPYADTAALMEWYFFAHVKRD